ncbi:MAG: TonB-dependent receptor [Alistipes sp.]|nr:TonB-dependent receptor [Alistipes sp.]
MKKDERLNFSVRIPSVRRFVVSLVLMLLAALPAAAQNKKITVDLDNVPVKEFIKNVESQSGYTFAYNNSEIDLTRRVSIKATDENVVDVVIRALSPQNLTARMEGSRIVVSRKPAAASAQTAQAVRGGVVTGTVKTVSGEPVIGASVIVMETNRGNVTGLAGDFSVEAMPGQTLSISFLGYNTQQIKVGNQTSFDVTLTEDSQQISEVLVVGYTPMRKSDFTGSIASVKASELSATTPTVGQSLVGKVAGVEVHQTSGAPGDGVTIRVRGVNSLSASSAPLYVIDGYPASEDVFINPSDIESIDILKDAASAAIYGSRGASGVVLITTKRGKDGEAAKVSYDFSYGIQQLDHKVDLLNSTQFRDLLIDARNNSYRLRATAAGVSWSPYDDNTIRAAKGFSLAEVGIHPMFYDFTTRTPVTPQYDTDWQDELFSNAGIMRHNVSVIGGTKAIKYMASVGYMDQDGIIAPSNHNRINARINLDAQITKRLTASISYSMYDAKNTVVQAEGRMINDGVIQSALMYLPNLPAYEENGDYARSAMIRMKTDWGMNFPENPLAIANELDITEKMSRHNLNLNLVYEFIPDLKLSARLGQQWYNYRYFYYRPMSIGRDAAPAYSEELRSSNIARTTSTYDVDRLGEFTLSYKKKIGRHHIDALAGYTLQKKTYDRLGVEATGFADDRIHEVTGHGSNASDISLYSTRKAAWAMMSFLTRVNYSFDDRYTLTGSFRADGSSRFGIDSRWGYFPSVSAGWTLSNEPFLKDALKDVASIRLRASWGKSGNNDIGNYASLAGISSGSYAFGQTPVSTTYEGSFTDAALGWETTLQTNIGLDLGFFNGRLNVIGNWYNSISTDILYSYPISSISGATSTTTNMSGAKIRNRGFDIQLDARLLTGKVNWNFSTNISVNRNKVVSMGGLDDIISTTERSVGSHITKEGEPIGSFYGYQAAGIMSKADYANALLDRDVYIKNGNKFPEGYQLKGPAVASYALDNLSYGNAIWKDTNGDGVITTDDKTIIGNAYPDFTGGFSTSLSWNGLDFSASFAYSYGGEVINFQDYYLYNMEGSGNQYSIVADRYISDAQPGRNNVPIASRISTTNTSLKLSSYYVEDASFFRCANITLGYTLPKRWTSKLHITSCRVYVSGDNLFTITPYRGYNPEVSYKSSNMMPGFDWGCYPLSRIYSVGLNLTF